MRHWTESIAAWTESASDREYRQSMCRKYAARLMSGTAAGRIVQQPQMISLLPCEPWVPEVG